MAIVGIDLRFEDFRRIRRYPALVPAIVAAQWLLPVAVAGAAGRLLDLPYPVTAGMLLAAAAPAAALSVYYVQLAGGHLALAVTVLAFSNAVAVVATPVVAALGFREFLGSAAEFSLPPARLALHCFVQILLPLLAGVLLRRQAPEWSERWRPRLRGLGVAAIAVVLGLIAVDQFAAIRAQAGLLFGAALAYTVATFACGAAAASVGARAAHDRRGVVWGFPAHNMAVAALLATSAPDSAGIVVFLAVLFATQVSTFVPLALWMRARGARGPVPARSSTN
jgi:BASS family bile acid:Na+ symporter